jgi:hypothetical protein
MELTSTTYDIAAIYALFCLATMCCIFILNVFAMRASGVKMGFIGASVYLGFTSFVSFLFAPIFFVVYVFYSEVYFNKVVISIINNFED